MSIVNTGTFGGMTLTGGLKKTIDTLFHHTWSKKSFEFEPVFKVSETDEAFVDDVQIQMPDEIEAVPEGGSYARVTIENVRTKRYIISTYKGELKITKEMLADSRYPLLVNGAEGLAIAARRTVEKKAAAVLYNGFTSELTPDGVSLFNTAHPLKNPLVGNPTTYSNRSSLALNAANVKARRSQMMKCVDEHGSLAPTMPDQLICTPDNLWEAKQIVKSVNEPFTADNQINVAGDGLKVVCLKYLAAGPYLNMWILRDSEIAKNRVIWRQKPQSEVTKDPHTGDTLYRIDFRIAFGVSHYAGLDGNTGES